MTAIVTGGAHTCAIAGGVNYCWGSNSHNQLGNEAAGSQSLVPVPVIGSKPAPVVTPTPTSTPTPQAKPASISTLAGKRKVDAKRRVKVATVSCPAGASCTVTVPKTVKVKINRKTFTLTLIAPKTLAGGRSANISLQLPKTAYARLKKRTTSVSVKITARAGTTTPTSLTVKATIRR